MHGEVEIRPVKAADQYQRVTHPQIGDNRRLHTLGGCRSRRQQGRIAEHFSDFAQAQIIRPEVMPPLADTVGLIDDEPGDLRTFEGIHKGAGPKPLRRDIDQFESSGPKLTQQIVLLIERLPRSETRAADSGKGRASV
jgi:hypothetical protein